MKRKYIAIIIVFSSPLVLAISSYLHVFEGINGLNGAILASVMFYGGAIWYSVEETKEELKKDD